MSSPSINPKNVGELPAACTPAAESPPASRSEATDEVAKATDKPSAALARVLARSLDNPLVISTLALALKGSPRCANAAVARVPTGLPMLRPDAARSPSLTSPSLSSAVV
ncbi:hypothetical protein RP29_18625 [Acidovorax temperans]|uniref:Uncharacterized protein n=1 Tax=Acidovorax temperans TaxID=80878 RepID=A0A0D7K3Z1_9BURK|nr:hypothetical protein RP29_18625 [Acidovorax temperans]